MITRLLIAMFALLSIAPVNGANLVTNPGFEILGGIGGWTFTTPFSSSGWSLSGMAYEGLYSLSTSCDGAYCMDQTTGYWFRQSLPTTPGGVYELSLFVFGQSQYVNPGQPQCSICQLDVYWAGTLAATFTNFQPVYSRHTVSNLVASGASTTLQFNGRANGSILIDNIFVDTAVPEPTTFLFTVGGLGLAVLRPRLRVTK